MLSTILALGIGGGLWLYWSWWYSRWRRWMRLDTPTAPTDPPETSSDGWFAMRQARERNQRTILLLLVGSVLFTLVGIGVGAVLALAAFTIRMIAEQRIGSASDRT